MVGRACCFLGGTLPPVTNNEKRKVTRLNPGFHTTQGFALGYRPPALQAGWMCPYEAMHPPHCSE